MSVKRLEYNEPAKNSVFDAAKKAVPFATALAVLVSALPGFSGNAKKKPARAGIDYELTRPTEVKPSDCIAKRDLALWTIARITNKDITVSYYQNDAAFPNSFQIRYDDTTRLIAGTVAQHGAYGKEINDGIAAHNRSMAKLNPALVITAKKATDSTAFVTAVYDTTHLK
jgi:hypothetical protein